jgi:hypothetical protein
LSDGALRLRFDDPEAQSGAETRHYESCPECQARYKAVAADATSITSLLAAPDMKLDVASAFERVRSAPAAQPRFGFRLPVMQPGRRPLVLAFAATVTAVALLVTAIASGDNIFSPKTITPVPVTVADLQSLSQLAAYGELTWTTRPNLQIAANEAEAQSVSGLKPPTVAKLPNGVSSTVTYAAMPKAVAVFTFSKDKAAAAAAQAGKPLPALPTGMDGAQMTVTVGPAVAAVYGNLNKPSSATDLSQVNLPQLIVAASSAPVATSTQVSVKQLADYIATMPGISPELATAIKAIGDSGTTLPVPVPIEFGTATRVQVQGVDGIALGDNTGVGAGVIWIKNGVIYGVVGTVKQADAIDVANHLT